MSVAEMVGWELLYKLIEKDLKTESDLIVAITHWYLINQAGFRCLGTGDEVSKVLDVHFKYVKFTFFFRFVTQKTLRDNEATNSTETLPENWNENSTAYALRYVHDQKVYILLGTVANDTIILNLLVSICFEGKEHLIKFWLTLFCI